MACWRRATGLSSFHTLRVCKITLTITHTQMFCWTSETKSFHPWWFLPFHVDDDGTHACFSTKTTFFQGKNMTIFRTNLLSHNTRGLNSVVSILCKEFFPGEASLLLSLSRSRNINLGLTILIIEGLWGWPHDTHTLGYKEREAPLKTEKALSVSGYYQENTTFPWTTFLKTSKWLLLACFPLCS